MGRGRPKSRPSMNGGGFGGSRNVVGMVRRTALPPSPVVIGLEKAAVGSPRNHVHDIAATYYR